MRIDELLIAALTTVTVFTGVPSVQAANTAQEQKPKQPTFTTTIN